MPGIEFGDTSEEEDCSYSEAPEADWEEADWDECEPLRAKTRKRARTAAPCTRSQKNQTSQQRKALSDSSRGASSQSCLSLGVVWSHRSHALDVARSYAPLIERAVHCLALSAVDAGLISAVSELVESSASDWVRIDR